MKHKTLLFLALFIVLLQLFIFFPTSIWTQNQFNFDSPYSDSLSFLLLIVTSILVLSIIVALITPKTLRKYLLPFLTILSVLIFIQQNILVWDYGILDGKNLQFQSKTSLGYIDSIVWFFATLILIVKRSLLIKHASTILVFTGIVTTSLFLISLYSYDFNINENSASITEDKKFQFSKEKNILVFVLDGFQSDLFWRIIENEPEITKDLKGFEFYPNTTAVFSKTYPSIPLLLTGKIYQKQKTIRDFLNSVYKDSILSELINSNWRVELYPYLKNMIPINGSFMSNYREKTTLLNKVESYLQALDLSFFRTVPHVVKRKVYNQGDFIVKKDMLEYFKKNEILIEEPKKTKKLPRTNKHRGINFLENMKDYGSVDSTQPAFKFYHLLMPHSPFTLNRKLEFIKGNKDFESYNDYAFASLKLMIGYLKELKKLGVYDNSAIIIVADHGGGEYTNVKYEVDNNKFTPIIEDGYEKASAKPLLLVKKFDSKEPFIISPNKPVSLTDVAPTIASFAQITPPNNNGVTIDAINVQSERERTFYYYSFTGWDSKYLQDFNVYKINGNIYKEESWSRKGLLTAQDKTITASNKYEFNKTITYGSDLKFDTDYQNQFIVEKNYKLQPSSINSIEQEINLSLPLNQPFIVNELYKLEIKASAKNNIDNIHIELNKQIYKTIKIQTHKDILYLYFQPIKNPPNNRANIKLTPEILTNHNQVVLSSVKLTKINLARINNAEINLSKNLEKFQITGFWEKAKWGRWSAKKESSLLFKTEGNFCQKGYIQLKFRKFYTNVDSKKFNVYINGVQLKKLKQEEQNYFYKCPETTYYDNETINLVFKTQTVTSPIQAGTGKSTRTLGFGLKSIQFGKLIDL